MTTFGRAMMNVECEYNKKKQIYIYIHQIVIDIQCGGGGANNTVYMVMTRVHKIQFTNN